MRPRLYVASKIENAGAIRGFREAWKEIEFTCRWIDMDQEEEGATPHDYQRFWLIDRADVARSDFLFLFATHTNQRLRGALVECGLAIAQGTPVIVMGEHPDYGSWQYHPLVKRLRTLDEVRYYISGVS